MLGTTTIHGLLEGEDVLHTADALRALGITITRTDSHSWQVQGKGVGGLHEPSTPLYMGNSGTSARLMMGLVASHPFTTFFSGDPSLSVRPMKRVSAPLQQMGAQMIAHSGQTLPLAITGRQPLTPITYELPVASAQVKSAIMLAALNTAGRTVVIEPHATRDHTERMMRHLGLPVSSEQDDQGRTHITVEGHPPQSPALHQIHVPADPSSAAFPVVAALIVPDSELTIPNVCLNPLRTGLFETLTRMGAQITISNQREQSGEPVGDLQVRYSTLSGVEVPASMAPSMIDEYPILAIAAAFATGTTIMRGLSELRVKESDRLAAMVTGLLACGVKAEAQGDDLVVVGMGANVPGGGRITTHYDHRIAMAFLVMGLASRKPVTIDDGAAIATSFPGFVSLMNDIGAHILPERRSFRRLQAEHPLVIAIDGPAASGKGTLARRLAQHYGLPYLDTGSLYRAVGLRLLYADADPNDKAAAIEAAESLDIQDLSNPRLRQERVGQAASIISAMPEVRAILLDYQRNFAAAPHGAVLDGRDIGTVVCPNADLKIFMTASIDARANRRHRELQGEGIEVVYQSVLDDLIERDARDQQRQNAPLIAADDAIRIDTTHQSANDVFDSVIQLIEGRMDKAASVPA